MRSGGMCISAAAEGGVRGMGGSTGPLGLGHSRPLPHLWDAGEASVDTHQAGRGMDLSA